MLIVWRVSLVWKGVDEGRRRHTFVRAREGVGLGVSAPCDIFFAVCNMFLVVEFFFLG